MIGEFIKAWAQTQSDIIAVIGSGNSMRLGPWESGRKLDFDRVVYQMIYGDNIQSLAGPTSLRRTTYQIEAQSQTNRGARTLAELFIGDPDNGDNRLDGYQGTLADVEVQGCHLDSENEIFEDGTTQPSGKGVHRVVMDFVFWWKKSA